MIKLRSLIVLRGVEILKLKMEDCLIEDLKGN